MAKPWFRAYSDSGPAPLQPGDVLRFVMCTQADGIDPEAGTARHRTRGVVLRHDPSGRRARGDVVGAVVMDAEESAANNVVAFLERAGATLVDGECHRSCGAGTTRGTPPPPLSRAAGCGRAAGSDHSDER